MYTFVFYCFERNFNVAVNNRKLMVCNVCQCLCCRAPLAVRARERENEIRVGCIMFGRSQSDAARAVQYPRSLL